jgi:hypothetical protein
LSIDKDGYVICYCRASTFGNCDDQHYKYDDYIGHLRVIPTKSMSIPNDMVIAGTRGIKLDLLISDPSLWTLDSTNDQFMLLPGIDDLTKVSEELVNKYEQELQVLENELNQDPNNQTLKRLIADARNITRRVKAGLYTELDFSGDIQNVHPEDRSACGKTIIESSGFCLDSSTKQYRALCVPRESEPLAKDKQTCANIHTEALCSLNAGCKVNYTAACSSPALNGYNALSAPESTH